MIDTVEFDSPKNPRHWGHEDHAHDNGDDDNDKCDGCGDNDGERGACDVVMMVNVMGRVTQENRNAKKIEMAAG